MPKESRAQRTEKPTGRRLKKAREEGNVPRSEEVSGAMVLVGFLLFAHIFGADWLDRLQTLVRTSIFNLDLPDLNVPRTVTLLTSVGRATALLLAPPLGMVAAAGLTGKLIQGPPPFTLKPLKPRIEKLNPVQGIQKIFAMRNWIELLKSLLKMSLYGAVAFAAARDVVLNGGIGSPGPAGALSALVDLAGTMMFRVALVAAGLAVLDWLFRRYDHTRNLMMSKKEVKDEYKELEGDPLVRSRVRQKQLALTRSRMMANVPKATVVVTNPTHVAVALRYVAEETDAPEVLAKGRALLAKRIREIAEENGVPIVSDPPLARALYKSVPVGSQVPPALFRAVAEVLALVFSKRSRKNRRPSMGEEASW